MQERKIGTTALSAAPVALGTWAMGGGPWWGDSDEKESIRAIHASLDNGITLIDTAPAYGLGRSEEIVGKALQGRRDKVILATKCGIWWQDARGHPAFELDGVKIYKSLAPETIRLEIELSLKRLNTDYIDLYQTHWPVPDALGYQIDDTMQCLLKLKAAGKIRAIGASNIDVPLVQEYQAAGAFDAVQPKYSILDRKAETSLLPHCLSHSISVLAYSPMEQGLLTGKIGMDYIPPPGNTRNDNPWFIPENRRRVLSMLESWEDLTEKYACSTSQLVIAWTIAQPGITFALCGARNEQHAIHNTGAMKLKISESDLSRMRQDAVALGSPLS